MKNLKPLLLTAALLSTPAFSFTNSEFNDYVVPENERFARDEPTPIDLSSYEGAKTYRTKLTEGAKKGPNFAGYFTVVQIGCGTQCQENWIINANTGKILDKFSSALGTKYKLNSTLMIVNPFDSSMVDSYKKDPHMPIWKNDVIYQNWNGTSFYVIRKKPLTKFLKETKRK